MASVANENGKLAKARAAVGDDYVPDDTEEYMNERQQQYFRVLLLEWKKSIHDAAGQTLQSLQDGGRTRQPHAKVSVPLKAMSSLCSRPPRQPLRCAGFR